MKHQSVTVGSFVKNNICPLFKLRILHKHDTAFFGVFEGPFESQIFSNRQLIIRISYENVHDDILAVLIKKAEFAYHTFRCKITQKCCALLSAFVHFSATH